MTTQVVFNIDPKIKARAMKRAKRDGIPFASVLKFAARAFADGTLSVGIVDRVTQQKMRLLERESLALDRGKGRRFTSAKDAQAFIERM